MTDVWCERARGVPRERDAHARAPTSTCWSSGRPGADDGARRRDRRRPRRAPAARGGLRGRDRRPRAGDAGRRASAAPRTCRSRTASFDVAACRIAAHHFADVRAAVREMARVARDRAWSCDNVFIGETSRRPRSCATRRTSATTARTEWRELLRRRPGCEVERRALRAPLELEPWLARSTAPATDAARSASCSATAIDDGRADARSDRARGGAKPSGDRRRQRHAARRAGADRQRGPLPRAAQPRLRHERRRRRHAGQGRPGRRRHPGLRHRRRRGRARPARTRR